MIRKKIETGGHSPSQWQAGVMTMTPKDGDLTDWSNYRSITLLSLVGKLFESIIAERIFLALEARGRIPAEQGGFWRSFGQSDHIFILSESIKYRARRGRCTYCAFLDIRKAFPTMHRASMLAALSRVGIGGKVWRAVERMYSSTSTRIALRGALSDSYLVDTGLREGSVMSPILYSVPSPGEWHSSKNFWWIFLASTVLESRDRALQCDIGHPSRAW